MLIFIIAYSILIIMGAQQSTEASSDGVADGTNLHLDEVPINVETGEINKPPDVPYLKVVCISDTHSNPAHFQNIPHGDVLVHAGDFSKKGRREETIQFNELMGAQPHKHKLVICGNHELGLDGAVPVVALTRRGSPDDLNLLTNVTYLQDSGVQISGVNFYGSPWCNMYSYAFYKSQDERAEMFSRIPSDTDVVITHVPPQGILDGGNTGCEELLKVIKNKVKPKYHVFGHIHKSFGVATDGTTTFINAAQEQRHFFGDSLRHQPIVFYIPLPPQTH